MGDTAQAPLATTQEPAFAPHFVSDEAPVPQRQAPSTLPGKAVKKPGFESQFVDAADKVSRELGVDTSAVDRADGRDERPVADHDPLGDAEVEVSPGKRMKRKELAAQLAQFEQLQKKQKDFERASHAKMQEAAEIRKQTQVQLSQAQEAIQIRARLEHLVQSGADEDTILREFGRDPDKYFQSRIERQYQDLQKTPEQRQQEQFEQREHALRQREQALQHEHQEREERVRQYQQEQQTNATVQQLSQAFMQQADKLRLPRSALTIQRFANLMSAAEQAGIPVTMEQLGAQVKAQYREETIAALEHMEADEDFQALPKTFQDKYRRSMLAKLGHQPASSTPGVTSPKTRQQQPMSTADYNDYINKLRTKGG